PCAAPPAAPATARHSPATASPSAARHAQESANPRRPGQPPPLAPDLFVSSVSPSIRPEIAFTSPFQASRAGSAKSIRCANLLRRQAGRAFGLALGLPDQFHDPARQRRLQTTTLGNLGDDALQIIDLGASAVFEIFPH